MFHKFASISLSLVLLAGIAAGCGPQQDNAPTDRGDQQETPAARYVPKELKVQVVPPHNAETLEAKAKPLEKLLGNKLNIPVKISASTNDHTVIEAMSSRQADIGFLPPNAYVLAHDQKKKQPTCSFRLSAMGLKMQRARKQTSWSMFTKP